MKTRPSSLLLPLALLVALAMPSPAEPKRRPLMRYAMLWTSSPFTVEGTKVKNDAPVDPAGGKRDPRDAEIEKLRARVRALEAELANLQAAPRDDAAPSVPAKPADGGFVPPRWLVELEPAPVAPQVAIAELEKRANQDAQRSGLIVKRRQILPDVVGPRYRRARVEIEVAGPERHFYAWLDRVHDPHKFQAVTFLRLAPKRDDDTLISAQVRIESWFLPEGSGAVRGRFTGNPMAELRPLTEEAHYPLELLFQVAKPLIGTDGRLDRIEVINEVDGEGHLRRNVRLHGSAPELKTVADFSLALKRSAALDGYDWACPPPAEDAKTGKWMFLYDATFVE